jgi:hypothetical protein
MNISEKDAQQSLNQIQNASAQMRKAVASSYASGLLILWGVLWASAFTATYFYHAYAFHIFMAMSVVGGIGTSIIWWIFCAKTPIKNSSGQKLGWRMFWFWSLLFVFIIVWLSIFAPFNGMQCNAFICTAVMFAYIVLGLWFSSYFMVFLGLAVTAATLIGYHLLTPYYSLWMALMGGGALLGTGLYIRICWR